jgi:hypothetical protein
MILKFISTNLLNKQAYKFSYITAFHWPKEWKNIVDNKPLSKHYNNFYDTLTLPGLKIN